MLSAFTENNTTTTTKKETRYVENKRVTRTNDTATGSFSLCAFVVHSPIFAVVLYWIKIFLRVKDHKVTEFYLFYSPVMNRAYSMALGEQQLSHQNEI